MHGRRSAAAPGPGADPAAVAVAGEDETARLLRARLPPSIRFGPSFAKSEHLVDLRRREALASDVERSSVAQLHRITPCMLRIEKKQLAA
jgi:hypothetical protein